MERDIAHDKHWLRRSNTQESTNRRVHLFLLVSDYTRYRAQLPIQHPSPASAQQRPASLTTSCQSMGDETHNRRPDAATSRRHHSTTEQTTKNKEDTRSSLQQPRHRQGQPESRGPPHDILIVHQSLPRNHHTPPAAYQKQQKGCSLSSLPTTSMPAQLFDSRKKTRVGRRHQRNSPSRPSLDTGRGGRVPSPIPPTRNPKIAVNSFFHLDDNSCPQGQPKLREKKESAAEIPAPPIDQKKPNTNNSAVRPYPRLRFVMPSTRTTQRFVSSMNSVFGVYVCCCVVCVCVRERK